MNNRFNNTTTMDIYNICLNEGFIPTDVCQEFKRLASNIYATFVDGKKKDETPDDHLRSI